MKKLAIYNNIISASEKVENKFTTVDTQLFLDMKKMRRMTKTTYRK